MSQHYNKLIVLKQVTRILPEDGAVCAKTCRRDLVDNNIRSTACVDLVGILMT